MRSECVAFMNSCTRLPFPTLLPGIWLPGEEDHNRMNGSNSGVRRQVFGENGRKQATTVRATLLQC